MLFYVIVKSDMRVVLIIAMILVSAIVILLVSDVEKESSVKVKISMEGSTFKNAKYIQKKDNQVKLILNTKETFMSDDGKLMELREVSIYFPEKNFTVNATKGYYYPDKGDFILTESVEGISKDFKVIATEVFYSGKDKMLYSEKPLQIRGKNFIIDGNSGKATSDLIELKKGVNAIVYPKN
jgi:LPS export ABC transporter protein LptC